METESKLRLSDVFVSITDPRQARKTRHDLVEVLVVAVNGVLAGADTFVEIEAWANEKLEWFRRYLKLEHGIPSHDTFGRLFGLIDPTEFESAFQRWVRSVLPALGQQNVVAIDGKTSRRSGKIDATAQGNRMNSNRTKSEELLTVFVRSRRNQPTHFDAPLAWDRVKADQIQRDVLEDGKIMRRMTGAGAHLVISEGHVHAPVQAILH